jgi:hypothetical protein
MAGVDRAGTGVCLGADEQSGVGISTLRRIAESVNPFRRHPGRSLPGFGPRAYRAWSSRGASTWSTGCGAAKPAEPEELALADYAIARVARNR